MPNAENDAATWGDLIARYFNARCCCLEDTDAILASPALDAIVAERVAAAKAAAWDEGAAMASPHGGGYLRSLYAQNPYRGTALAPWGAPPHDRR